MNRAARTGTGGFTLVEVLVAVTVFALLATAAYTGLDSLTRALDAQRERSERFAQLQRTITQLDRDLRQLVSRTGRDGRGRPLPALAADRDGLLGRRAGWSNPAALPRSALQQFRWQLRGGVLVRESWFQVDDDPASTPVAAQPFGSADGLQFRFLDTAGQWHSSWPIGDDLRRLPRAIEYQLSWSGIGTVRRIHAL
ncbi:MAG: type II secretion system minor pseudopilin GspJ [Wenzhouxiangellaceae bacterium]|nr:type II secretion system minor pseudopilin GspJ [Wenzhouxiangellaceae bacterium]